MSTDHELSRDSEVDLGGIFSNLWRRKGAILLAGLIALVLAWAALMVIKPRYNSQVSILIQNSDAVLTRIRRLEGIVASETSLLLKTRKAT